MLPNHSRQAYYLGSFLGKFHISGCSCAIKQMMFLKPSPEWFIPMPFTDLQPLLSCQGTPQVPRAEHEFVSSYFRSGLKVISVYVKVVFYQVKEFPKSGFRKEPCLLHSQNIMRNLWQFVYSKIHFSALDNTSIPPFAFWNLLSDSHDVYETIFFFSQMWPLPSVTSM